MCATRIDYEPYCGNYSPYRYLRYLYMRVSTQTSKISDLLKFSDSFYVKIMQNFLIFIHCGPLQIILHTPTYTTIPTFVIFTQTLTYF